MSSEVLGFSCALKGRKPNTNGANKHSKSQWLMCSEGFVIIADFPPLLLVNKAGSLTNFEKVVRRKVLQFFRQPARPANFHGVCLGCTAQPEM